MATPLLLSPPPPPGSAAEGGEIFVREYRVEGNTVLSSEEIDALVRVDAARAEPVA